MFKTTVSALLLWMVFFFAGHWSIFSTPKEKLSVLKMLAYSFACATIVLATLTLIVLLF